MNKIVFPLRRLMQDRTVADLQDVLQLLLDNNALQLGDADDQGLVERLRAERLKSRYGQGTQNLVELFQAQRQLDPTGEVDEPTTDALNQVLEELRAFHQAASDQHSMADGRVRREDVRSFGGGLVRAFHVDERGVLRLGEDTTDAEGRYTIRYARLPGVDAIALRVAVYGDGGQSLRADKESKWGQVLRVLARRLG